MTIKTIFGLSAVALTLSGCLSKNLAESSVVIKTDSKEIVVPAEFSPDGTENIVKVNISANRSWFAHLNDIDHPVDASGNEQVSWASLDVQNHENLTNVSDEASVSITFVRNLSNNPVNGTLDIYSDGGKCLSIPISQSGAVYHLDVTSERTEATCSPDKIVLKVNCNTEWSARIADGATAGVSLDCTSGFDPGEVVVSFTENFDASTTKEADIVFSATGCPDKTVHLTQSKAIPYINLSTSHNSKLEPRATQGSIVFQTNVPWTASVNPESTLENIVLSSTSGLPSAEPQSLTFTFSETGDDPHIVNNATIVIQAEGVDEPLTVKMTQRSVLTIQFKVYPEHPFDLLDTYPLDPYFIYVPTSINTTGYECSVLNCRYRNVNLAQAGLQIKQDGRFGLPVISGMTLKSVTAFFTYHNSFKKLRLRVTDNPEDAINFTSGMLESYLISADWIHTFVLGEKTDPEVLPGGKNLVGPKKDTRYYLYCDINTNNLINKLELAYEPDED